MSNAQVLLCNNHSLARSMVKVDFITVPNFPNSLTRLTGLTLSTSRTWFC